MILNHYIELEQESREKEALNAIEEEADKNAELYGYGELDAQIGAEPDPRWAAKRSYRRGYQDSFWQFYDKKHGIKLETEF